MLAAEPDDNLQPYAITARTASTNDVTEVGLYADVDIIPPKNVARTEVAETCSQPHSNNDRISVPSYSTVRAVRTILADSHPNDESKQLKS
jgi:hypothetical protein